VKQDMAYREYAAVSRREGLGALIRRPVVQLTLLVAAAAQVVAVRQEAMQEVAVLARLAPMVVTPAVVEDSPAELVAEYKARGYPLSLDLAEEIHEAATEQGIDPEIAFGLVRAESSFRNAATSTVGAVGLTQLMPSTARWIEPGTSRSDLRDPETNLRLGFTYLRQLIEKYEGDVDLALVAYNRGPGTVDKALKRGRDPDNGYAAFVRGEEDHGHRLFTR
jgi:soluble lytic murein transglycosylase-like protein